VSDARKKNFFRFKFGLKLDTPCFFVCFDEKFVFIHSMDFLVDSATESTSIASRVLNLKHALLINLLKHVI